MARSRSGAAVALGVVVVLVAGVLGVARSGGSLDAAAAFPATRDARQWPFAWNSIWNLPRGDAARLVPAGIRPSTAYGMTVEEDILILEPDAPKKQLIENTAGWNGAKKRCTSQTGKVLASNLPVPNDFSTEAGYIGVTPNHSGAVLLADGVTVFQTQPLHVCGAGGAVTSQYVFPTANIVSGDGIAGAHGGSGLSSLGGAVRLGELVPGGAINHAVKLNVNCAVYCSYAGNEPDGRAGFRWPARNADSSAPGRYNGPVGAMQMGSLLTLPANFDESRLGSEPARILARAIRDYGGYVVDDTGWDVYAFATEWSPDGRVTDEFKAAWGHSITSAPLAGCGDGTPACQWSKDMATVFSSLHVVDDNGPASIGGAGARLAPCAPPFADGTGGAPEGCSGGTPVVTTPSTTPTTAPAPSVVADILLVTDSPTRTNPTPLEGATFAPGDAVFVHLAPANGVLSRVEFWIDNPTMAGAPKRTENAAPYDLGGGNVTTASAYSLAGLAAGPHTITARRTTSAGVKTVATASFTIEGSSQPPATTTTTTTASTEPPPTTPTTQPPPPVSADELRVAAVSSRAAAAPLQGAVLAPGSSVYVFLAPANTTLSRVEFWVDDPARVGRPVRVESIAPYDLGGGSVATASPYALRSLPDGPHTITARRTTSAGVQTITTATFTIRSTA